MLWKKLIIHTNVDEQEVIFNLLSDIGIVGLEIENKDDDQVDITSYHELDKFDDIYQAVQKRFSTWKKDYDFTAFEISEIDDSAWLNVWKDYYHAKRITSLFTIVPIWENYEKKQTHEMLIKLDPETSFGTGTHETTVLMIEAMQQVIRGNENVIDIGTGSGVLSIAAKRLGVNEILATDIDADSVEIAKKNYQMNFTDDSDFTCLVQDNILNVETNKYNLVLANILADVIEIFIPQVSKVLTEDGRFLISGIADDQVANITNKLHEYNFTIEQSYHKKYWNAFITKRVIKDE